MDHGLKPLGWTRFSSLISIPTAGDGSCALHAIVQSFHVPYQMGRFPDGSPVDRYEIVRAFRNELADKLNKPIDGSEGITWYDKLSRGGMEEYAKNTKNIPDFPDLSREGFEKHLRSHTWLGQEVVEYVSEILKIGIIIIFSDGRGRYELNVLGKDGELLLDNKRKVVIIMNEHNHHYTTVGRKEAEGVLRTFFDASDSMVREMAAEFTA